VRTRLRVKARQEKLGRCKQAKGEGRKERARKAHDQSLKSYERFRIDGLVRMKEISKVGRWHERGRALYWSLWRRQGREGCQG
jgi:hypothetical protein